MEKTYGVAYFSAVSILLKLVSNTLSSDAFVNSLRAVFPSFNNYAPFKTLQHQ